MTRAHRLIGRLTFVTAMVILNTALSCGGGQVIVLNKCDVVLHTSWPGSLVVTKPASCPVQIPAPAYPIDFAEGGRFDPSTLGTYRLTVYDANDQFASANYNVQINTIGGTLTPRRDTISVTGTYSAGNAGFRGARTDKAVNDLEVSGTRRLSTVMLTYQQLQAVSVVGPTVALPYETITLDSDLHVANAVPPLSWTWLNNGNQIGSQETVTWSGAMQGPEDFTVTIRDGNDAEWSQPHRIYRALISGPKQIQPGATCTWQGIPFEGTSPYSYNWENHGLYAGNQQYYTGSKDPGLGGSFNLRLVITDATEFSQEQTITVYEDSGAPVCLI